MLTHLNQQPPSIKRTRDKALLLIKTVSPVTSLKEWLAESDITDGPAFRPVNRWGQIQPKAISPGSINDLLKTLGKECGFDFVPD